ncbi:hypothetical protein LRS13_23185 [Svornostia abyssi]|uniref:SGNH hydrolase-type esterase domain-containing protein n=1 Tax=Svornostia abyssi TaxID=2898438 RepID=A0ABY5PFX8_9ACTN|nr:hypothetical protein LRS13_23185 [Parviterribacteraceae bacterium J379]
MNPVDRRTVIRLGLFTGGAMALGPGLSRLVVGAATPGPAEAAAGSLAVVDGVPTVLAIGGLGIGHVGDGALLVGDDASAQGRPCTVSASTDLVTMSGHGLQEGDPVVFGSLAGAEPLKLETTYYVRDRTAATFALATSPGGPRVDITADSSGTCRVRSQAEMGRKRLYIEQTCDAAELVFANFATRGSTPSDAAPSNPIMVKAALELVPGETTDAASGVTYPAYFEDGEREAVIPPGGVRVARVAQPIARTGVAYVRYRVSTTDPKGGWPRYQAMATDTTEGERAVEGSARLGDRVDETGWQAADGTNTSGRMYAPLLVRAHTAGETNRKRAALILGDSIASPKDSWVVRGLHAAGVAYVNLARPSEGSFQFLPSGSGNGPRGMAAMRRELLAATFSVSDVIVQYGRNHGSFTSAQIQAQIEELVAWLLDLVEATPRVHLCTVTPKSRSTNGFTTPGGQTPDASNPVIQQYNQWVRSSPAIADAVIDVAALAEDGGSAAPTGRWQAPGGTP